MYFQVTFYTKCVFYKMLLKSTDVAQVVVGGIPQEVNSFPICVVQDDNPSQVVMDGACDIS